MKIRIGKACSHHASTNAVFSRCDMEIWKDIKGYEGLYQVSNFGNVRSVKRNIVLSAGTRCDGRKYVTLCKNGKCKTFKIHRLVAIAFIPNLNNYKEVNHKDENPSNNYVGNLEWCDRNYNQHYGTCIERMANSMKGKFTGSKSVLSKPLYQFDLNGEFIREWESIYEVKRKLGINPYNISSCCNNKRKSAGGFIWKRKKEAQ